MVQTMISDMQTLYAILYFEINLFAAALLVFIRVKTRGISRMASQENFACAVDAEIVFFMSDAFCVLLRCGVLPFSSVSIIALKTVYFFSTALMCYYWFIYFELLQGSSLVNTSRKMYAWSFLVGIMGVLLVINYFNGMLFYVDADGEYHRGRLFLLQYLFSYTYVLITCFRAFLGMFREKNHARRGLLLALSLFPIAPAAAGIIQIFYPELPVACVMLSLATLFLYQRWIDQMISIDPLTNLNNRKQLVHHYEQWQGGGENELPMHLLLIDANKFKSINDTFGHIEGDNALVMIADSLRTAAKKCRHRALIARYGGDEFIILAYSERSDEIEALCRSIHDTLSELSRDLPYELSVSIGCVEARKDTALQKLIEEADEKLYEAKKKR